MTAEPIRIPVTRQCHMPGVPYESVEITPDHLAAIARALAADPELAGALVRAGMLRLQPEDLYVSVSVPAATTTNPDGSLKPVALRLAADGSVVSDAETGHDDVRARSDAWCAVVKTMESHGEVLINQPEPNGVLAACGIVDRLVRSRGKALADLAAVTAELGRARGMANATWADMQSAGQLCGQRDDEYPLQAVQRFVRDATSADLAAVTIDRDNLRCVEEDYAKHTARARKVLRGGLGKNYLEAALDNIDALTAQRDRLAGLLAKIRNHPTVHMPWAVADMIDAALAELEKPTPTTPTNGEGDTR